VEFCSVWTILFLGAILVVVLGLDLARWTIILLILALLLLSTGSLLYLRSLARHIPRLKANDARHVRVNDWARERNSYRLNDRSRYTDGLKSEGLRRNICSRQDMAPCLESSSIGYCTVGEGGGSGGRKRCLECSSDGTFGDGQDW
jgi:uncharacterized protein (DUF58 family)